MLYKLLLVSIIVLCSGGIGQAILGQREEEICKTKALLQACMVIADEMALRAHTLVQALRATGNAVFEELAEQLFERPENLRRQVQQLLQQSELRDAAILEALENFLCSVGTALTQEQLLAAKEMVQRKLTARLEVLQQSQQEKSKVVRAMSVSIGLTIAVILL